MAPCPSFNWLPDFVPTPLAVAALAFPAVGMMAYLMAGRHGGDWIRIPAIFYVTVAFAAVGHRASDQSRWPEAIMMNAVFAAVLIGGGIIGAAFSIAAARVLLVSVPRRWRASLGRCHQCAYDLTGNASGVCPECGTVVAG